MTLIVKEAIDRINSFETIERLHEYIMNELNLDSFTDEEFDIVWKHMNLQRF